MKKYFVRFFFFFVLLFNVSCANSSGLEIFTPLSATPTQINAPATNNFGTTSLTPSVTARPVCSESLQVLPAKEVLSGTVVLSGYLDFSGANLYVPSYLLTLESMSRQVLPQIENFAVLDYATSPDQSKLAYLQYIYGDSKREMWLTVTSAIGDIILNAHFLQMDIRSIQWLNNDNVALVVLRENRRDFPAKPKADVWLLNMQTQRLQKLPNEFPGQWSGDETMWWSYSPSATLYHPNGEVVVYPSFVESSRTMKIFNWKTEQILAEIETADYGRDPAWSPDGQYLSFITHANLAKSGNDILVYDMVNGKTAPITHFYEHGNTTKVLNLFWNSESDEIAFFFSQQEDNPPIYFLGITDRLSQRIQTKCARAFWQGQEYLAEPNSFFWSPDESHVLFNMKSPNAPEKNIVVVMNIRDGTKYLLDSDTRAVGWLR